MVSLHDTGVLVRPVAGLPLLPGELAAAELSN